MKPTSCLGCPYYDRPGPHWGSGSSSATIAFVGAHPADKDFETGEPFSGGAGKILDNACYHAGISRAVQFSTNVVKCLVKPGEYTHPQAVRQCQPLLNQELEQLRHLRVIVPVGEASFKAFTGKKLTTVTSRTDPNVWLRGCVWPLGHSRSLIPIMDPAFYARTGFFTSFQMDTDLQKIARFSRGEGRTYELRANYSPTRQEVEELVADIRRLGRGGIDIETPEDADEDELAAGGQPLPIDVIGLSSEIGTATGVPPDLYPCLEQLFSDEAHPVKFYVYNASFDFYHLGKRFRGSEGGLKAVKLFDCMLALSRWRSDLQKKDLGIFMTFFTDMEYCKNLAKTEPTKYQWSDTTGVLEGGLNIEPILELQGLLRVLNRQDHPLIQDLVDPSWDGLNRMREIGIKTDLREVFKMLHVSQELLAKYQEAWNKFFPSVDWQSPKQLGELFTGPLKLPPILRTRVKKKEGTRVTTKTPTCDVGALEEYRDKYDSKVADMVLKMRTTKHIGDFAGMIRPDTNRLHTAYGIHRQVQFRIQAFDPNIQTLPEVIGGFYTRRQVIPDTPDDEIISIDGGQVELRMYAWVSKCQKLLDLMATGEYIYGKMYEQIYKKPFFKEGLPHTKYNKADYVHPQEILAAKSGPLGFIYDRGWESLVQKLGLDPRVAKEVHSGFHAEYPEIRDFHKHCDREVAQLGYQTDLWGGRRYFPGKRNQRNEYLSFHGQANWAELLRQNYLIPCFRHLKEFGARVLLTVHDSMAVNCPKRNLQIVAQFILDHAESPIPQMDGFRIPAEIKHGPNWQDTKLFETEKDPYGRTLIL